MVSSFQERPQAPAGMHLGVLIELVEIGTQMFNDDPASASPKLSFQFELPEERMEDGKPIAVGAEWTVTTGENGNLAKNIKSWTGEILTKNYDYRKLLGKAALVSVVHSKSGYAKVDGVSALMKGQIAPKAINPLIYFDLDELDLDGFEKLNKNLQGKITKSREWKLMQKYGCGLPEARMREQEARKKLNPMAGHSAFDDEVGF